MKSQLYLFLIIAILISSCSASKQALHLKQYDKATRLAIGKLQKNKNKWRQVKILETAFAEANKKDLSRIQALERSNKMANAFEIYQLYQKIQQRQMLAAPLMPLYNKKDLVQLHFTDLGMPMAEAQQNASSYLSENAEQLLSSKSKENARLAYNNYIKLQQINPLFPNLSRLTQLAKEKGTTHYLIHIESPQAEPSFEQLSYWKQFSQTHLSNFWNTYTIADYNTNEQVFDRHIKVKYLNFEVSPEQIKENNFIESKIIEEQTYVYDAKGKPMKDSSGKLITKIVKTKVHAKIKEITQLKSAIIKGLVEMYTQDGQLLYTQPITYNYNWQHVAVQVKGDQRALSGQYKACTNSFPVTFPDNGFLFAETDKMWTKMASDVLRQHS